MTPPRVYWDANVMLSYLNAVPERLPVIEELLRQSRAAAIEIVTSALSIAEVAFAQSAATRRACRAGHRRALGTGRTDQDNRVLQSRGL